ncbi:class I SAM-dependent methyltransferase [bacterium]|nr:class I SAM-dependent methyltransferase [bacterium]
MHKPFSEACERNKAIIFDTLKPYLKKIEGHLLEVGTGTGQHAVYMAPQLEHITWHTSDVSGNHMGIKSWLKESKAKNIKAPIAFKVGVDKFPKKTFYQAVYSANTFHIMSWKQVKTLIKLLGHSLRKDALVFIYGPFKYKGQYTSDSNEHFDQSLKETDPQRGIRNFEDVHTAFEKSGFILVEDHIMPANNQLLVFKRLEHG